jgi:hypothetical protein
MLRSHAEDMRRILVRLGIMLIGNDRRGSDLGASTATIRRFPALLALSNLQRHLHRIHQRLMSLYPIADEEQIENARMLEMNAASLFANTSDRFSEEVAELIDSGWSFLADINELLTVDRDN